MDSSGDHVSVRSCKKHEPLQTWLRIVEGFPGSTGFSKLTSIMLSVWFRFPNTTSFVGAPTSVPILLPPYISALWTEWCSEIWDTKIVFLDFPRRPCNSCFSLGSCFDSCSFLESTDGVERFRDSVWVGSVLKHLVLRSPQLASTTVVHLCTWLTNNRAD